MKWPEVFLSRVCQKTGQHDPRETPDKSFLYVDISSVDAESKSIAKANETQGEEAPSRARKRIASQDVLVSTVRPNRNAVALVPEELDGQIASTGFSVLRARKSVLCPRFLFYFVRSQEFIRHLTGSTTGAHYPAVSDGKVKSVPIPLPPLSEQRRIVEILDQADALRTKRADADAKAQRILPALFYHMFGDPVTNPKGWPRESLRNLFHVVGGGTPSKKVAEYWNGDIPWVSPKDMKTDVIVKTEDYINPAAIQNSATNLVTAGTLLVVYRSGILAHSFPVALAGCDLTINQDLKSLSPKGNVSSSFLFGLFVTAPSIPLSCVKKGATVHNIDGSSFLALEIPKPPQELQQAFSKELDGFLNLKGKRKTMADAMDKLFSTLLHRAFTGDLTAKWREVHMQELLQEMEQQAKALDFQRYEA